MSSRTRTDRHQPRTDSPATATALPDPGGTGDPAGPLQVGFEVPLAYRLPDLSTHADAAVASPTERRRQEIAFDTPDGRLRHRSTALTLQRGDDVPATWNLTRGGDPVAPPVPAGPELTAGRDDPRRVPDAVLRGFAGELRAVTRGADLRPAARIDVRRIETLLLGGDGVTLGRIVDEVYSARTSVDEPGSVLLAESWRQLTIAEPTSPGLATLLARDLRAAGAHDADRLRPLERLAAAVAIEEAGPAGRRETRSAAPVAPAAGAATPVYDYLREHTARLLDFDPLLRRGEPEAVHTMRVSARRLRSTLATFGPLLGTARTTPVRAELKWLIGLLGEVRDREVLSERLRSAVAAEPPELVVGPVAARVTGRLDGEAAKARTALLAGLDSDRYLALLDALDALPGQAEADPGRKPTPTVVRKRVAKVLRRVERRYAAAEKVGPATGVAVLRRATTGAPDHDEALHATRKAAKRARYAVEAVRGPKGGNPPVDRKAAKKAVARLVELQDVLGDQHDTVVARAVLRDYGMRSYLDGDNAFSYGVLHARQAARADALTAQVPATYTAATQAGRTLLRR